MRFGETSAVPSERLTMVRGMAFLFAAGATLVLVTLLLPASGDRDPAGLVVPAVLAYGVALALVVGETRVPRAAVHVLLVFGSLLVTSCVTFGGGAGAGYALLYVWVALYAAYFLGPAAVAAQTTLAAALAAVALVAQDDVRAPVAHWTMGVGTAVVLATLVNHLARSMRGQRGDLAAAAAMTGDPGALDDFREQVCERLRRSARVDGVTLLEPAGALDGLSPTASAGDAGGVLAAPRAQAALDDCAARGERVVLLSRDAPPVGLGLLRASVVGLAQPVLRHGAPAGVLALAWARPRRVVPERASGSVFVMASVAGRLLEQLERRDRERERRALQINDAIVQGLVVAKYAMAAGNATEAARAVDDTLAAARRLVTAQLDDVAVEGEVRPGDLVRRRAGGA